MELTEVVFVPDGEGAAPSDGGMGLGPLPMVGRRVSDGATLKFVATVKLEYRGRREGAREIVGEDGADADATTDGEGGESKVGEIGPCKQVGESKADGVGEAYCRRFSRPPLPAPGEGLRARSESKVRASWC